MGWLSLKNHLVASLGEFVGTFLFLFMAFAGTQLANLSTSLEATGPDLTRLTYISLIFGFSLAINVWVFFRISGGLFNPAVTLALCICGGVSITRSIFIFVAQILGSIAATAVVYGIIPGDQVLFNTELGNGATIPQGLFLEMFLTAELVFTILMLAAEKTKATFVAPIGIGLAFFVAELVGVYWTGGSLNPARSFGPSVIGGFHGTHWIYWLGPVLGALLACGFYKLLKYMNYEEVNGDQDKSAHDERVMNTQERSEDDEEKRIDTPHKGDSRKLSIRENRQGTAGTQRSPRTSRSQNARYNQREFESVNAPNRTSMELTYHDPPTSGVSQQSNANYNPQSQGYQPHLMATEAQVRRPREVALGSDVQPDVRDSGEKDVYETRRDASPPAIFGVDGRPYVQNNDAQQRQLRRKSNATRGGGAGDDVRRSGSRRNRDANVVT